jgi:predicted acyl esterase
VRSTDPLPGLVGLCLLALPTVTNAQDRGTLGCEPPVPTGGFSITQVIDTLVTYTDGYQTLIDLRYPNVTPTPSCGWPLITLVHGGGLDKSSLDNVAIRMAAEGYAILTYDFRASGPSYLLNDPLVYATTLDNLRERIDLFEVIEFAEATWPQLVDETRIGVSGGSSGGITAWAAAAHSGQLPPPNPWRTEVFPTITAIVPEAYVPDFDSVKIPQGKTISDGFINALFNGTVTFLPSDVALLQGLVLSEDWQTLKNTLYPASIDIVPLLAQTNTAWAIGFSYDDRIAPPDSIINVFNSAPAGIPHRMSISTGNHGAPKNDGATDFKQHLKLRWFARFLKGIQNGVDTEPPVRLMVTPEDANDYRDKKFVWDKREHTVIPPPSTMQRFYFDTGGALATAVPGVPGAELIQHRPTIDINTYAATLPTASTLMTGQIPLSDAVYTSAPIGSDLHLHGKAAVQLYTNTADTRYQVHVALFDAPPFGIERFVADGFLQVWDDVPPGDNILNLNVQIASYVFRKGHSLRVKVSNLTLHAPSAGGAAHLRAIPVFSDFDVQLSHGPTQAAYIDIPVDTLTTPSLSSQRNRLSETLYVDCAWALNTSSDSAGLPYLMLLGLSGTSPGTLVGGVTVPLNADPLTTLVIGSPLAAPFANFFGVLDGVGRAQADLALSTVGALGIAGTSLSATGVVLDPLLGTIEPSGSFSIPIVDY